MSNEPTIPSDGIFAVYKDEGKTSHDAVDAVRKANQLRVEGKGVRGAVECDFDVPDTGWYELLAEPAGGLNEFILDG